MKPLRLTVATGPPQIASSSLETLLSTRTTSQTYPRQQQLLLLPQRQAYPHQLSSKNFRLYSAYNLHILSQDHQTLPQAHTLILFYHSPTTRLPRLPLRTAHKIPSLRRRRNPAQHSGTNSQPPSALRQNTSISSPPSRFRRSPRA